MSFYTYKVHHVPISDENLLAFLAGKFASLRLSALTVSAAAFSSTFEIESAFTASQWIERLKRPMIHTFVAVAYGQGTAPERQTIDAGDFIGSATLVGPFSKDDYEVSEICPSFVCNSRDEDSGTAWELSSDIEDYSICERNTRFSTSDLFLGS